jgi:hypothetical protein
MRLNFVQNISMFKLAASQAKQNFGAGLAELEAD